MQRSSLGRSPALLVLATVFAVLIARSYHLGLAGVGLLLVQLAAFAVVVSALQPRAVRRYGKLGAASLAALSGVGFFAFGQLGIYVAHQLF